MTVVPFGKWKGDPLDPKSDLRCHASGQALVMVNNRIKPDRLRSPVDVQFYT